MRWKDKQSKNRLEKRNRMALFLLLFITGLLVLSWTVQFSQKLFSPLKAPQVTRNYRWNGKYGVNLVVRSTDISVLSYNPEDEKVFILRIPDETFLDVPNGFGSWQIRAVYGLGKNQLLKEAVGSFLGIPVDGFVDLTKEKNNISALSFVAKLRENPFSGLSLLSNLETDLTMWELIKLKKGLSGVRFDKVKELDLIKTNILQKSTLPDGTEIYTADPVQIDSIAAYFADPFILSEHKTIAIFNAAGKPQLAQKWARVVTNMGGNVIITANAKKRVEKTQIVGEESETLKRLRQIFDLDCQNNPKCVNISLSDEDVATSRAQINLFLGEDFAD